MMSANIFVSFASKDVRVAMTLCAALESRGFSCWISARDIEPGANFQSAIVRALRQAKILLLVFTANSNTSEEMTKELALASQNKMIVIPLRVEDVTPNDAFAYEFATRQWIDVFADWEVAIEQLSRRIGQALLDHSAGKATGEAVDALKLVMASAAAARLTEQPAASEDEAAALEAETPPAEEQDEAVEVTEVTADLSAAPDDELWAAETAETAETGETVEIAETAPAEPARRPVGLLIAATAAVLVLVAGAAVLLGRGSPHPPATPKAVQTAALKPGPSSAAAMAPQKIADTPVVAVPAAPAAEPDPAAASSLEPAAPKPVKHRKAVAKVDIPF